MSDHSRRTFVKGAAATAAALGAAGIVGAESADAATPDLAGPHHKGPFVVWVENPASGEVSMLVGEKTVVVKDAALARRLARLAAGNRS